MNFKPIDNDALYEGYDEWNLEKAIRVYNEKYGLTATLDIIASMLVKINDEKSNTEDRKETKI